MALLKYLRTYVFELHKFKLRVDVTAAIKVISHPFLVRRLNIDGKAGYQEFVDVVNLEEAYKYKRGMYVPTGYFDDPTNDIDGLEEVNTEITFDPSVLGYTYYLADSANAFFDTEQAAEDLHTIIQRKLNVIVDSVSSYSRVSLHPDDLTTLPPYSVVQFYAVGGVGSYRYYLTSAPVGTTSVIDKYTGKLELNKLSDEDDLTYPESYTVKVIDFMGKSASTSFQVTSSYENEEEIRLS